MKFLNITKNNEVKGPTKQDFRETAVWLFLGALLISLFSGGSIISYGEMLIATLIALGFSTVLTYLSENKENNSNNELK